MQKPTAGRQPRKWYVIYRDAQGVIVGLVWEIESQNKPIRWAETHGPRGCTYTIEETQSFDGGYKESKR